MFSLNVSQQREQYKTGMKGYGQLTFSQKDKMWYTGGLQKTLLSRSKYTFCSNKVNECVKSVVDKLANLMSELICDINRSPRENWIFLTQLDDTIRFAACSSTVTERLHYTASVTLDLWLHCGKVLF